jgi:CubicO group peptidase (beta-lactamase class C family)
VLLQARLDGHWASLRIDVEDSPPHRITALAIHPAARPADVGPHSPLTEEEIVCGLAAHVDTLVAADIFSGAVLLARDGVPLFSAARGLASVAFAVPMRLDTKMNLGSMNKMFTAVAIIQLMEQGKLALGDCISTYLPTYPRAVADRVTIHHLLTHTAGLGSYCNDKFEATKARLRTVNDFLPLFIDDPLDFEPGER